MSATTPIGEFEQVVLLVVLRLQNSGAYGVTIREEISRRTRRDAAPGAIYTTLDRLESKGLVTSEIGESTPERGGRAKRYYYVSADGIKALKAAKRTYDRLLEGLVVLGGSNA